MAFLLKRNPTLTNPPFPTILCLAVGIICALAGFFRVWGLGSRNLWTDEAWVALAALQATPAEALGAGWSTPPLYILTLWGLGQLLGGSEAALRSLSLIFGMGAVLLFIPLARRLAPFPGWLAAAALMAASPVMVYFSKELKQYSGDAFFAVLIFLLAERLLARGGEKGWAALALAGVMGLGFSHPMIFTLPVAAVVLGAGIPQHRWRVMLLGALWAGGFAAYYLLFIRHQVNPELTVYWAAAFPDFSSPGAFIGWLGESLARYCRYFLGEWGILAGVPLLVAGLWALARQGTPRALFYLGGPLLLALVAAAGHRYPFMGPYGGNRLMLFSAPLFYLVTAMGLTAALGWLWRRRRRVAALALAGLVLLAFQPWEVVKENLNPSHNREEIQPLVDYLEKHAQPHDWVYVYYFSIAPFKYYGQRVKARLCLGVSCTEEDLGLPQDGRKTQRLWLIASHIPSLGHMKRFAQELLDPWWKEKVYLTRPGAVLYCFERQAPEVAAKDRALPSGRAE